MKKRIFALLTVLMLLVTAFVFAGCGDKKSDDDEIYIIYVDTVGSYRIEKQSIRDFTLLCEEKI